MSRDNKAGPIWLRLREETLRGGKRGLSLDRIVQTAIAIADADGIAQVSMRKVAAALNSGTMSLYRYVQTKEDLHDLMLDAAIGEYGMPEKSTGSWRSDLTIMANQTRAMCWAHPWTINLIVGRPPLGPNVLRSVEFTLSALDGLGLDIDTMSRMSSTVRSFAAGFIQNELSEREAQRRTGMSEEDWRAAMAPYVFQLLESGEFPLLGRYVHEAEDYPDMDKEFQAGLDLVLDGIAAAMPQAMS